VSLRQITCTYYMVALVSITHFSLTPVSCLHLPRPPCLISLYTFSARSRNRTHFRDRVSLATVLYRPSRLPTHSFLSRTHEDGLLQRAKHALKVTDCFTQSRKHGRQAYHAASFPGVPQRAPDRVLLHPEKTFAQHREVFVDSQSEHQVRIIIIRLKRLHSSTRNFPSQHSRRIFRPTTQSHRV
jgi:hypothetical protein